MGPTHSTEVHRELSFLLTKLNFKLRKGRSMLNMLAPPNAEARALKHGDHRLSSFTGNPERFAHLIFQPINESKLQTQISKGGTQAEVKATII